MLCNDSGALHIGIAVGAKVICISNGFHFGIFHPYPKEIYSDACFLYPEEIMSCWNDPLYLKSKYMLYSPLRIKGITFEEVRPKIDLLLRR
jgi:ADP-heptose:LPS heptosyltransferase